MIKIILTISLLIITLSANAKAPRFKFKATPFNTSDLNTIPWGQGRPPRVSSFPQNLKKCLSNIRFTYRVTPNSDDVKTGTIVVNNDLVKDLKSIFKALYKQKSFTIESVIPIKDFAWDDNHSMEENNTSGFNYRYVSGTRRLSNHSMGRAIDINPRVNPWVSRNGSLSPSNGTTNPQAPGSLLPGSPNHNLVREFKKRGWTWGGDWSSSKDYQHFEKKVIYPGSKFCKSPHR